VRREALPRAGDEIIILEASNRVGGGNLTLRSGDLIDEVDNPQRCEFDDEPHLYLNAGSARISHNHHKLLADYKALGVELEFYMNDKPNAWMHDPQFNGGNPMRTKEHRATDRAGLASGVMLMPGKLRSVMNIEALLKVDLWR